MPNDLNTVALNDEGDIYTDAAGNLVWETDYDRSVAMAIRCKLKTVRGEWYQDPTKGFPLLSDVVGKGRSLSTLRNLYASEIATVDHVKSVDSVELSLDNSTRKLSVKFSATTDKGGTAAGEA
jgi:hypothetical protein